MTSGYTHWRHLPVSYSLGKSSVLKVAQRSTGEQRVQRLPVAVAILVHPLMPDYVAVHTDP